MANETQRLSDEAGEDWNNPVPKGRPIPFFIALIPFLVLIPTLYFAVKVWEIDPQIPLFVSTIVAAIIGLVFKWPWKHIEKSMVHGIMTGMQPILVLFIIGMLIGSWILSGIVPSLIYYSMAIINPNFFLPVAMIICSIIALACGSSWTTAGTVGVALMVVAQILGINPAFAAGAIISGSYFGDKLSPLSDTTNLAPAIAGSDLFDHIREMMPITVVAYIISFILFTILGLQGAAAANLGTGIVESQEVLSANFFISPWLIIVPLLIIPIALFKVPALPGLIGLLVLSSLIALFAGHSLGAILGNLASGFTVETADAQINDLLTRGGFNSMMWTVTLIIFALSFGGVMEGTGMLKALMKVFLKSVHTVRGYIIATISMSFGMNTVTCDQYLAIAVTGKMFKQEYGQNKIPPVSLSNALETSGTVTSALIPWNTCGITMAGYLGVSTLEYMPYAFFNYITPIVGIIFALLGIFVSKGAAKRLIETVPVATET